VPVTVLWAAKGGSGTTVVTAGLALACTTECVLVDLAGDLPTALGVAEPSGQGVGDWLRSDAPPSALADVAVEVDRTTRLIPRGQPVEATSARWPELVDWLVRGPTVFVDGGTGAPPPPLLDERVRTLLVTRACYVALERAKATRCRPDGVILVAEPGRSLRRRDVERCVGARVVASVSVDIAVARAVDSGLLRARVPRLLTRELRGAA